MSVEKHIEEHKILGLTYGSAKVLSVGQGGRFATIQAAIDYIATQTAFTPVTMNTNGTVTSWSQGASAITMATIASTAAGQFVPPVPTDQMWFLVAGDAYYYKLEATSNLAVTPQVITSRMRRIEANVSGTPAVSWYKENRFVIRLIDSVTTEDVTISSNCFITFVGDGSTTWCGAIEKGANFDSGGLRFQGVIHSARISGGAIVWGANPNTISFEYVFAQIDTIHDDYIFPGSYIGELKVLQSVIVQNPTAAQGHCLAPSKVYGDFICMDNVWRVESQSGVGIANVNNSVFADLPEAAGSVGDARNLIVNGLRVIVNDAANDFDFVSIVGNATNSRLQCNVMISDVTIQAPDAGACSFHALTLSGSTTGMAAYIERVSMDAINTSGSLKLVDAGVALGGASTVRIGRGNTVNLCDAQTNLTYTAKAPQITNTATVTAAATTVVVTHGLGYTPSVADITIVPTLLSNSTKWWVTAVGATTFTINVDVVPGAGTATFVWKIGI